MSWSASFKVVPQKGVVDEQTNGIDTSEANLQYQAAKLAVAEILNTGALGGPVREFTVNIGGHANPGNKPVSGWSNDFVSIQIVQEGS